MTKLHIMTIHIMTYDHIQQFIANTNVIYDDHTVYEAEFKNISAI